MTRETSEEKEEETVALEIKRSARKILPKNIYLHKALFFSPFLLFLYQASVKYKKRIMINFEKKKLLVDEFGMKLLTGSYSSSQLSVPCKIKMSKNKTFDFYIQESINFYKFYFFVVPDSGIQSTKRLGMSGFFFN